MACTGPVSRLTELYMRHETARLPLGVNLTLSLASPSNPMMTTQSKDITKNGVDTVQTSEQDFAIGSQEELTGLRSLRSYTWRSFFRSVLLQMILFGL
jgi:hypothetical protein